MRLKRPRTRTFANRIKVSTQSHAMNQITNSLLLLFELDSCIRSLNGHLKDKLEETH